MTHLIGVTLLSALSLYKLSSMLCSGPMQTIKGIARQIQGALPVVGLLSRLGSPSGGIGNDVLVRVRSS